MPSDALGHPQKIAKTAVDTRWPDAGDSGQGESGAILVLGFPTSGILAWGWDRTQVYDDGARSCSLAAWSLVTPLRGVATHLKTSCVTMGIGGRTTTTRSATAEPLGNIAGQRQKLARHCDTLNAARTAGPCREQRAAFYKKPVGKQAEIFVSKAITTGINLPNETTASSANTKRIGRRDAVASLS
ncbi:hypothetical protein OPT61_g1928 [Boeremia exigua]|uniref:Uncharacterized protein n=1 Tax=Boeremia exigua TaxID=749465 RepID=A0ACC2INE3_9PLEO|nr:hypothetical protein OPT61_g1928 [Boeremia exigua]